MHLICLPKSAKGIREKASREGWEQRRVPGRGGRDGMRIEYQPPVDVQRQIDEIQAQATRSEAPQAHEPQRGYVFENDFVMVPRYDVAGSAGNGSIIHSEQIVDHLAFKADWVKNALGVSRRDLALISVKGDSMEPTLSDGDLILIDTSVRRLEDSAVYVLRKDSGLFVKRIHHKLDGTVIVKSDNQRYDAETYGPEVASSVQVVGRVVWAGRKF